MEFPSVVLTLIFSFLEIEDLVRAARVCKDWWKVISRGVYLKEAEPYELDLSRSEDAYRFVPLKMFALSTHLNISSTRVSNRHFEQLSCTAENLEFLDISNCSSLEQRKHSAVLNTWTFPVIKATSQFWQWRACAHVKVFK